MDLSGGESSIAVKAGEDLGKRSEMQLYPVIAKANGAKAKAAKKAKAKAEEAAKASENADEARRLKDKEAEWAQSEEELFASMFRRFWNRLFARGGATFHETTSIPAMRYAFPLSDERPMAMETLMIISVNVASIKECLRWPLQVYGIVAARDVLDHKRNIIFQRPRINCQTITQDDPYLALTGPSRAVAVSVDPSYIEVLLKVKGATKSEDKDLSHLVVRYRSGCLLSGVHPSRLSTLEFKFGHIYFSVEATICVKVTGGSWPDGFRGVFSAGTSSNDDWKVKLLDFADDGLPVGADGIIKLSRHVVSVELEKMLKISVMAFPVNKEQVVESCEAALKPQRAGISSGIELNVGSCSMEVGVVWSFSIIDFLVLISEG